MSDEFPFDINGLAVFLAVCDASSMTEAARRLGVTQPAVSIAISELENRLNAKLINRAVRPLALTSAGVLLRQRASALLSEARQIKPMMREVGQGRLPLLRVGVIDSLARSLSPAISRAMIEIADDVAVLSGLTASHASALLTRNLDVMIGLDDLADVPDLERWPLLQETYVLALPAGAPPVATLAELQSLSGSHRFVRFSSRSSTGIDVERHLRRVGLEFPRRLEFDTPHGVTSMVAQGGCFTITTPLCLVDSGAPLAGVACVKLPGPALERRITLVTHRNQYGRATRVLVDTVLSELQGAVLDAIAAFSPFAASCYAVKGSSRERVQTAAQIA